MAEELEQVEGSDVKRYAISAAKARLSELVDEVRTAGTHVVIHRRSKDAAVLMSTAEFEELIKLRDTYRTAKIAQALKGEKYDLDEVIAELDLGV